MSGVGTRGAKVGTLAGAPVRVTVGFLASTVLLYLVASVPGMGLVGAILWLPVIAGSILAHEAGHALVAKANHQQVTEVALTWHGGHVIRRGLPLPAVDLRVSLAGPAASLAVGAACWALSWLPLGPLALLLGVAASLNLTWGLFNLLPIPGLDGAHALEALGRRGR